MEVKPSIFEIFASESFDKICFPAFKKIVEFPGARFNMRFLYSNEISLALNSFLQYLYIFRHDASFGEYFYDLKRLSTKVGRITWKDKIVSAMSVTLPPYLHAKLKNLNNSHHLKNPFLAAFATYEFFKVLQICMYLMNLINSHTPLFSILKLKFVHPTSDNSNIFDKTFIKSLEIAIFFLQFINWWNSNATNKKTMSSESSHNVVFPNCNEIKNKCPICLQDFSIPTASSISGHVYCYKCIAIYLQSKKMCPVTNYPMDFEDLIRIYDM